ncbi:MAG: restriction endonuclease subunit R [Cyanobacteriota bacterium]|nr:restriction endonuclease subunit R [Cyanobacteriota bacterium]
MFETITATNLTLHDIETKFNLQFSEDEEFFREWLDDLPIINDLEIQGLDKLKADYLNNIKYQMLENTVKMVVLAPLLYLADLYIPPFHIESEKSVELVLEDEDKIVRGSIDILVLKEYFWVVAIEAKRSQYSLEVGLPQLLFYMLTNLTSEVPTFGLLTNGSNFRFVKLMKGDNLQYSVSRIFDILNPGNDLHQVFQILKRLSQLTEN